MQLHLRCDNLTIKVGDNQTQYLVGEEISMKKEPLINVELLNSYIERSGLRLGFIAKEIGLTMPTFRQKRYGRSPFLVTEMFKLCYLLHIEGEDREKIFYPER